MSVVLISDSRILQFVRILTDFARFYSDRYQKQAIKGFSPAAESMMTLYNWPGNVRELRNTIERIVVLESSDVVEPVHLPREMVSGNGESQLQEASSIKLPEEGISLEEVERDLIAQALAKSGSNRTRAAKLLSLGYDALRYKIKKYGLE